MVRGCPCTRAVRKVLSGLRFAQCATSHLPLVHVIREDAEHGWALPNLDA